MSRAKLARQVDEFTSNADAYRRRGIVLLGHDDLVVDVGFCCRVPVGPGMVAMPLAVRFEFTNYDIWAPSLDFIDPLTREPLPHPPFLRGLDFRPDGIPTREPADVFIDGHPQTGRAFVCKRGVREYHLHFEHNGDDWLLYRGDGFGTLARICDMLWRHTTRTVTGLHFVYQHFNVGNAGVANAVIELRREDIDLLAAQVGPQVAMAAAQMAALQGGDPQAA